MKGKKKERGRKEEKNGEQTTNQKKRIKLLGEWGERNKASQVMFLYMYTP